MWPYSQTPPLEKCEQPDLKHPQAMLQNDICPQNSPEGGRVSPPGPRTIYKDKNFETFVPSKLTSCVKRRNVESVVITQKESESSQRGSNPLLFYCILTSGPAVDVGISTSSAPVKTTHKQNQVGSLKLYFFASSPDLTL